MKTSKSVDAPVEQLNLKSTKPSKKVKNLLKDVDPLIQNVVDQVATASNKALQAVNSQVVEYNTIGIMNLRRTKRIPDASPQTIVLSNEVYQELLIRGIRLKYTWDEVVRTIISNHLQTSRDSSELF